MDRTAGRFDGETKAQASSKTTYSEGNSSSSWHLTLLSKDGDVLITTHPEIHFMHGFKHHFESVCKYINGKNSPSKRT